MPAKTDQQAQANPLAGLAQPENFVAEERDVPQEVKDWAEAGFKHYTEVNKNWRKVHLPDEATAKKVVEDARHYVGKMREVPLTVQVREIRQEKNAAGQEVTALIYRVRDRVNSGRKQNSDS